MAQLVGQNFVLSGEHTHLIVDRLVEGRPARLMSWTSIVGTAIPIKFGPLMLCIFLIQAFCLDIV